MISKDFGFSMGQTLSFPMLIIGIFFIILSFKNIKKRIS